MGYQPHEGLSLESKSSRRQLICSLYGRQKKKNCRHEGSIYLCVRTSIKKVTCSCSAISIFALLAWSASHCSFRLTRSPRFHLRRMPHWGTTRIAPPSTATGSVLIGKPKLLTQHKKADHREGDPFFVEHRRFELLTPTLPVLCATNCANAPNSGYIIITSGLCKAFFSVRFLNSAEPYSKVIPAIILSNISRSASRFSLRPPQVMLKMVFPSLNRMVSADCSTSPTR